MADESTGCKLKVNDRVKRKSGVGCHGVVKEIRKEITASAGVQREGDALMIRVHWDNGTQSYFCPEALEAV
jgi:hypothetical protein